MRLLIKLDALNFNHSCFSRFVIEAFYYDSVIYRCMCLMREVKLGTVQKEFLHILSTVWQCVPKFKKQNKKTTSLGTSFSNFTSRNNG